MIQRVRRNNWDELVSRYHQCQQENHPRRDKQCPERQHLHGRNQQAPGQNLRRRMEFQISLQNKTAAHHWAAVMTNHNG